MLSELGAAWPTNVSQMYRWQGIDDILQQQASYVS